jgi:hypothetical protein
MTATFESNELTSVDNLNVRRPNRFRRLVATIVGLTAFAVPIVGTATPSDASTATTYGFQCNPINHWVRQNWPNIATDSATNVDVYMQSTLYKWTNLGWQSVRTSPWYNGVSNNTGRKALGYLGGVPYHFVYHTATGTAVAPQMGHVFNNLASGYYATIETFWVNGQTWTSSGAEFVAGTRNTWCQA